MYAKIAALLLLCLLAASNDKSIDASAVPLNYFNFTHVTDDGRFYASYHRKDEDDKKPEMTSDKIAELTANHTDKIYGGSKAFLGQFPFMVIIHRLAGKGEFYVCGGSILSKRWVLTAGHCVVTEPQRFLVVFGVVDKTGFGYDHVNGKGIAMIANQGALHPGYALGQNDIALLYMPKDIPFRETIQPIRLAGASYKSESFVSRVGNIYGWGKEDKSGHAVPHLKYGRVVILPNSACSRTWNIDQTQICTQSSTGQDVCQGDSGGPLVVFEKDDEPIQVGIVSYGDAGCPSNRPSVFTRVSAYLPWIKNVTGIDYK